MYSHWNIIINYNITARGLPIIICSPASVTGHTQAGHTRAARARSTTVGRRAPAAHAARPARAARRARSPLPAGPPYGACTL